MMSANDPKDTVSRMVRRLMRGPQFVVMNPETIQKEIEKGGPVQVGPDKPMADAIRELFKERKIHALEVARKLIPCPICEPLLIHFYDQIRACVLFKLHSVAITLCGTLVEYSLKYCSYLIESKGSTEFDPNLWETFERDDFGRSIQRAFNNRLLNDKTKIPYTEFKNSFRNPYAHFDIQKLTKDLSFGKVDVVNTLTGEAQKQEVPASNGPAFQMLALETLDSGRVLDVFKIADRLVQHLFLEVSKVALDKAV